MTELRYFKLTNGDEVVCEMGENNSLESDDMLVKNVLRVVQHEDTAKGLRYFTFRPWILLQDSPEEEVLINIYHVIAETTPSKQLIEQYHKVMQELTIVEYDEDSEPLDEATLQAMNDEENYEYDEIENVIKFKTPTVH